MNEHRGEFPVTKMAKTLQLSRSRYYARRTLGSSARAKRDAVLLPLIQSAFDASRRTYGSPRIYNQLRKDGVRCSENRVARVMRENGISARQKRKFVVTTDSKHTHPVSPNLLNRDFSADRPQHGVGE